MSDVSGFLLETQEHVGSGFNLPCYSLGENWDGRFQPLSNDGKKVDKDPRQENECKDQENEDNANNTNNVNVAGINEVDVVGANTNNELLFDLKMPALEDISTFNFSSNQEDADKEADINNMDLTIQVSPTLTIRIHKDHPLDQVIEDLHSTTQTRNMSKNLEEHGFITTIHQRTNHTDLQSLDLPYGKRAIGTKWVFRNKKNERGIVIRYKARLMSRVLFFMERLKNRFMFANLQDLKILAFLIKCTKLKKALYGLHQASRAWYETMSTYLLDNGFHKGKIDKTLFIRRHKDDILLVQVYVDDIIFGSTKKDLCNAFEKMMHEKFQMSSMGELTFFLGLQVKQKEDGIFISRDKYVDEILKKYGFSEVKNSSTPIETQKPLLKDEDDKEVDVHMYRSMIGSLMYLTSSRPDIMFAVCACVRYQVNPKVSHLHAVKRIFSDYAGASLDRKSTIGGCQFLRCRLISWQCKKQTVVANSTTEAEYVAASSCYGQAKTVNGEGQLQALVDEKKIIITDSAIRRDLQLEDAEGVDCLPNAVIFEQLALMGKTKKKDTELPQTSVPTSVANEAVNEEMDDSLERDATTATSLDAEQDRGNISKTHSKATPNEPSSQGTSSGGSPRYQEAMRDTAAQTRSERVSKIFNDPLLAGVNTPRSGDDSLKINELMELCTNLRNRVLDIETTKTTQVMEIESLKKRIKKLEKKQRSRTHKLKRLYKVGLSARVESSEDESLGEEDASKQERIADIDANEDITLLNTHDEQMFDADQDLSGEEVFVAQQDEKVVEKEVDAAQIQVTTAATTPTISIEEATLAQELAELKHDKGKAKMIEELVKLKKKDQIQLDEEVALKLHAKLQAEFDKEQNYQLAERLQAEEQQELNEEEKAKLFMQLLEKMRKFFAAKRAEEKRNKPPTQAQQRKIMCTYLKNMEGKKLIDFKNKSFDSIQKMFDRFFKRKINDNKEIDELKRLVNIIPDEERIETDAIPLAVKPPSIVDWKIHKEEKKTYYQIIRADGSSKIYLIFSHMLKDFDREDVETLWKLVNTKYGSTRPEGDYERVLWGDLKVMFELHIEDEVSKMQQRYKVLRWTLFNSCGVHCLSLQSEHIYMLVEKRYPLTPVTITDMLNKKLHADNFDEMTY
nr:hypothetical protein [Tanacetum cinerariifolium]